MEMSEDQKVIALLVSSGNVEQEKVVEARMLARSFDWNDSGITKRAPDRLWARAKFRFGSWLIRMGDSLIQSGGG